MKRTPSVSTNRYELASRYRTPTSGCPTLTSSSYCVNVREYTDANPGTAIGCEGDWGCAKRTWFTPGYHLDTARVYSNNSPASNTAHIRTTACHEIGHALGVEHRPETSTSCMADPQSASADKNVIGVDKTHIATLYNHTN